MSKFERGSVARFAAAAGLGLTLALGAAPVVAVAEGVVSAAGSQESTQNVAPGDEGVVPAPEGVAEVNGNSYESLAGAIAAAPDDVQTTVTLVGDIVMKTEDIVTIPAKKNIVLDMAGHKITPSDDFTGRPIVNHGTLTVTGNGTIDVSSASGGSGSLDNFGTMTVENGTFRGNLKANGANVWNRSGATATFNGGRFDTNGTAVATEADSTTYINGGHFESPWYPALENKGNAYLTGGEFVNTSCSTCDAAHWGYTVRSGLKSKDAYLRIDDATVTGTQGGVAVVGGTSEIYGGTFRTVDCAERHGAVFYALYVAGESYKTAATVYGGTFSSEKRVAVLVGNSKGDGGNEEEATLVIKGGSFSGGGEGKTALAVDRELGGIAISEGTFSSPVPESYCADGFKPITTPNADGQYVVARSKGVVKVGDQAYDSIQDALDSVKDSAEKTIALTLDADVYENVTIPEGYDVTLDLNGFTLTNDASDSSARGTIYTLGTLTLIDGAGMGVVDNLTNGKSALYVEEGATATLSGGTLRRSGEMGELKDDGTSSANGNSYYTIVNRGSLTINEGATVQLLKRDGTPAGHSSIIDNGWFSGSPVNKENVARLVINGGTIEGGKYLKNDSFGVLEIHGGNIISGANTSILNWNEATIDGGTFDPSDEAAGIVYNLKGGDSEAGSVDILGGTFITEGNQKIVFSDDAYFSDDQQVLGGTFTQSPLEDIEAGYVIRVNNDGTYTVVEKKNLTAGEYQTVEGDDISPSDLAPGYILDDDGNVIARPVPPVVTGDRVNVAETDGGKVSVTPTRADEGDEVTITATPDEGQEVREVTVTDEDGKAVTVKAGEKDGEFVFTMPDGAVTVTVTFGCDGGELCPTHGFNDVDQDAWYHDAVDWAVTEGVLNGYGEGGESLGPVADVTRAEMAQMLWNRAGRPEAEADLSEFTDVDAGGWYAPALEWCVSEGIFSGYGDTFGTERVISREEAATVLWRIAGSPEADADLSGYGDASKVSDYATGAIEWAVSEGVLTGKGNVALDPQTGCTRGEVAAMMMRMAE